MALPLPRKAKKAGLSYNLPKDGIYRVIIKGAEDKTDEFENSKRRGNEYYNLRLEHENKRLRFERVDYLNKEGDNINTGYNFILAMREIALEATEIPEDLRQKIETQDSDSDEIFGLMIKYSVPFYAAFKIYKADNGMIYTNLNNYFDPFYEINEEVEERMERSGLKIVDLSTGEEEDGTEYEEYLPEPEEDEDDDW